VSEIRKIKVEALTRVEGEGGLDVTMAGDKVTDVQLRIYEPPRFFEGFLRGRSLEEVPDITARICGICPVAYQMSAVHAMEDAMGISTSPEIRRLRRLLYCGEWIESHALHMHLLHAPDFFGAASGIELAARFPDEINRGLMLKKHGNQLLEVLGGRAIHPINVRVGGFYRAPKRTELQRLIPDFEWCLQAAIDATKWVASFDFPDFECDYDMVALRHPDEYPMNEGQIVSTSGLDIDAHQFEQQFDEYHVRHSTALQSQKTRHKTSYHVGPLARVNLNRDRLSATTRRVADEIGFEHPCRNPFRAIVARGLEVIHACDEALDILRQYKQFKPSHVEYNYLAGTGCAATEAPRGLIYHRYEIDSDGSVMTANIIPPTSQNQKQIENDLRAWLPRILQSDDAQTALDCERLIRSYDPCISCSTHFLKLNIRKENA
jgi:coenzyme F420-reducing hydrogenase alpha subunit